MRQKTKKGKKEESAKKLTIEQRRNTVFKLALQGLSQEDIAQTLDVDRSTVARDLDAIRSQRVASIEKAISDFNVKEYWQKQIDQLEKVLHEMWVALAESKGDRAMIADRIIDLQKEIDQRYRAAGIKTSLENPEDIADQTLKIVWEMPQRKIKPQFKKK